MLDVARAEQNAANARASLINGDEARRQARELLGLTPGSLGTSVDLVTASEAHRQAEQSLVARSSEW
jgi:hypothetical protein